MTRMNATKVAYVGAMLAPYAGAAVLALFVIMVAFVPPSYYSYYGDRAYWRRHSPANGTNSSSGNGTLHQGVAPPPSSDASAGAPGAYRLPQAYDVFPDAQADAEDPDADHMLFSMPPDEAKLAPGVYSLGNAHARSKAAAAVGEAHEDGDGDDDVQGFAVVRYAGDTEESVRERYATVARHLNDRNAAQRRRRREAGLEVVGTTGGVGSGGGDDDDDQEVGAVVVGQCYGYFAEGSYWRTNTRYALDTSNAQGLSASFVAAAMSNAAARWNEALQKRDVFNGRDTSRTAHVNADFSSNGYNDVVFGALDEPGALAITVLYGVFSAYEWKNKLVEFDMVFDDAEFSWSDATVEPMAYDLPSVAVHEFGHAVGMIDISDAQCVDATMYYSVAKGATNKRTLASSDVAGVRRLYKDDLDDAATPQDTATTAPTVLLGKRNDANDRYSYMNTLFSAALFAFCVAIA